MARSAVIITTVALLVLCLCQPLQGCRFNVRETGFVDLGRNPYQLFVFFKRGTAADLTDRIKRLCETTLKGSNVRPQIIDVDAEKNHPARAVYRELLPGNGYPLAVLVSPDEQALPIPLAELAEKGPAALESQFQHLLDSPLREKIRDRVIGSYGVVLLVTGSNEAANTRARKTAGSSIQAIKRQMKMMPKVIKNPPVLLEINQESLAGEQIFLWCMGLTGQPSPNPRIAIFYGRMRWFGPLMSGDEISERNLSRLLYVIGQDCECGLDTNWILGTMLPCNWDSAILSKLTDSLGFDVENPLIKREISRILKAAVSSYPSVPVPLSETGEKRSVWSTAIFLLSAGTLLILIGGLFLYLSRRRRSTSS